MPVTPPSPDTDRYASAAREDQEEGMDPVRLGFQEALRAVNPAMAVQAVGRLPLNKSEETFRLRMAVRVLRVLRDPVRELMLTSRTLRPMRAEYPEGMDPDSPSPLTLR